MAIDSPLSPIFRNVYMEDLEQKAPDTYYLKPKNVVEICRGHLHGFGHTVQSH